MKEAPSAVILFVSLILCCLPAAGQHSLPTASQRRLDSQLLSAVYRSPQTVALLLEKGANIEAKNNAGQTALLEVADFGKTEIVRLLLNKGANIEAKESDGKTALLVAVDYGNTDVVKLLLDKGASPNAKGSDNRTALTLALESADYEEEEKRAEIMKFLLDNGADIEARNSQGETVLFLTATEDFTHSKPKIEVAKLLLDRGANIEARNNEGTTVLLAAVEAHQELVQLLLDKGANIEARNEDGNTLLMLAVHMDAHKEFVQMLLDKGVDIDAKDKAGNTALDLAKRWKHSALADLLEQAGQKRKQLEEAKAKDPRTIFASNLRAYQQNPKDEALREIVILLANSLPEPPPIPEAARQLFVLASGQIKQATTPGALDQPIVLLRKATDLAPWWGNAYYNLSRALEMSGQYDDAIQQLKYYLELKPAEADDREAQAHIVVIQTEKEAAAHKQP